MSLGLFSTSVYADEVDTTSYKLHTWAYTMDGTSFGQMNVNANGNGYTSNTQIINISNSRFWFFTRHTLTDTTGAMLFRAGKNYNIYIDNLYTKISFLVYENTYGVIQYPNYMHAAKFIYSDGTTEDIPIENFSFVRNTSHKTYAIKGKVSPSKDVAKIEMSVSYLLDTVAVNEVYDYNLLNLDVETTMEFSTLSGSNPLNLVIEVSSEEAGLLDGILGWCKNIFNKVEESWQVMSTGFANIGTWFAELPGKLWTAIENGLKDLFVPDDAYMQSYQSKWDDLLSDRLGAVYQVGSILTESWDSIMNADETNTINFPEVTLPLGDTSFSFGGYDVKIVPDGFDGLVTALKVIVGIVCTCLFINGLSKRYDEVMGVVS